MTTARRSIFRNGTKEAIAGYANSRALGLSEVGVQSIHRRVESRYAVADIPGWRSTPYRRGT